MVLQIRTAFSLRYLGHGKFDGTWYVLQGQQTSVWLWICFAPTGNSQVRVLWASNYDFRILLNIKPCHCRHPPIPYMSITHTTKNQPAVRAGSEKMAVNFIFIPTYTIALAARRVYMTPCKWHVYDPCIKRVRAYTMACWQKAQCLLHNIYILTSSAAAAACETNIYWMRQKCQPSAGSKRGETPPQMCAWKVFFWVI